MHTQQFECPICVQIERHCIPQHICTDNNQKKQNQHIKNSRDKKDFSLGNIIEIMGKLTCTHV